MITPHKWFISNLRASAFFAKSETSGRSTSDIYTTLFGKEPEQTVSRKGNVQSSVGLSPHHWRTTIGSAPGRLDYIQETSIPGNTDFSTFSELKCYKVILGEFAETSKKMLSGLSVNRIALAGVLQVRTSSLAENTRFIYELVPYLPKDPMATDLQVRVNRPRVIDGDIAINRVAGWASMMEQMMEIDPAGVVKEGEQRFLLNFDADINTKPLAEGRRLPPEMTDAIISGLVRELIALVEGGDAV